MNTRTHIIHLVTSLIVGLVLLVALNVIAVHLFHRYVFEHFIIAWLILSAVAWVALRQLFPRLTHPPTSSSDDGVSGARNTQTISGLTILTGVASGVRHAASVEGAVNRGNGNVHTKHHLVLRVDGRPAEISLMSAADVADGETVSIAGTMKSGTFRGFAIRNDSTHAIYSTPTTAGFVIAMVFVIIGVPFLYLSVGLNMGIGWLLFIGLFFMGIGAYLIFKMHRHNVAARMLRTS
jgi:hypothetical protein